MNQVNRPPVLETIAPIISDENQLISFTLKGSDPDSEDTGKLVYEIEPLPEGAVLDASSGQFTWTPTFEQSGVYNLTARVKDPGGLSAEMPLQITVNHVNRPPVVQEIAPIIGKENQPLTIRLPISDPDKEDEGKLTVEVANLPEGAILNSTRGEITWTPTYEQSGEYTIVYTVKDPAGATAEGQVQVRIEQVNRPPSLPKVADQQAVEDQELSVTLPEGSDPDREDDGKLTYQIVGLPQGASFEAATRTLRWKPGFDQAGKYQLTYQVTDGAGATAEQNFTITVKNTNRPPKINVPGNQTVKEGEVLTFTVSASDPDAEDGGKLRFSAEGLPSGAKIDSKSGVFSWKPGSDQQGQYQVTFVVRDGKGLEDRATVKIVVEDVPPQEGSQQ